MSKIEIKARPHGLATSVTGWIDGQRIIEIDNDHPEGKWRILDSVSIPLNFSRGLDYAECVHRALQRAKEYGAE